MGYLILINFTLFNLFHTVNKMESIDQINKSITETQTKISEIEEKIKNIGFFI